MSVTFLTNEDKTELEQSIDKLAEEIGMRETQLPSKNLSKQKWLPLTTRGVTFTRNDDGSVTLTGTAQSDCYYIRGGTTDAHDNGFWLAPGRYHFSGAHVSGKVYAYLMLYTDDTAATRVYVHYDTSDGVTFTINDYYFAAIQLAPVANADMAGVTLYIQIEEGTQRTEYVSPWLGESDSYSSRLKHIENSIALYNGGDALEVPGYYHENHYLTRKVNRINSVGEDITSNGDLFFVITDQHWDYYNAKRSPALMRYLSGHCNIPRLFSLGDIAYGTSLEYVSLLNKAYSGEIHHVVGNHDYDDSTTGSALVYYLDSGKEMQVGNADRHYYYVDNRQQKIRYIIMSGSNESSAGGYLGGYEADQITWLTNEALNVEDGWSIILFTHSLYSYSIADGSITMYDHANPFIAALDSYSGNGEIIALFAGHTHHDAVDHTSKGIPIIVTACDKCLPYIDENGTNTEPEYATERPIGTITEQAFDVVALDKANRTLTLIRIGAPADNYVDGVFSGKVEERVVTY